MCKNIFFIYIYIHACFWTATGNGETVVNTGFFMHGLLSQILKGVCPQVALLN